MKRAVLVLLMGCGGTTHVEVVRRDGTTIEGDVVRREGEVLFIEPNGQRQWGDVSDPVHDEALLPLAFADIQHIDASHPGPGTAVSGGLVGTLGLVVGGVAMVVYASPTPDTYEADGFGQAVFLMGSAGGLLVIMGLFGIMAGGQQLEESKALLRPSGASLER